MRKSSARGLGFRPRRAGAGDGFKGGMVNKVHDGRVIRIRDAARSIIPSTALGV
jgi:hypothetical protein